MISTTYDQGAKRFVSLGEMTGVDFIGFSASSRRRASPADAFDFAPFRFGRTSRGAALSDPRRGNGAASH